MKNTSHGKEANFKNKDKKNKPSNKKRKYKCACGRGGLSVVNDKCAKCGG